MAKYSPLQTKIDLSSGEEDWLAVRECFVRAFRTYPLYTYMIPNSSKRDEFLRRYIEAIYDAGVRNGDCLVLCVKIDGNGTKAGRIIGGVMFAPPSENGGWKFSRNEEFEAAYAKYKLKEFYPEAYERMQRYEDWEYDNITKHICTSGIPLWAGAFCAMDPEYAGRGGGNMCYQECIRHLERYQEASSHGKQDSRKCVYCRKEESEKHWLRDKNEKECFKIKLLYSLSILNHHPKSFNFLKTPQKSLNSSKTSSISTNCKCLKLKTPSKAMIFALSHSRRAVNFYQNNGFRSAAEICYLPGDISCFNISEKNAALFHVNVLFMDPFQTGKLDKAKRIFGQTKFSEFVQKRELCA